MTKEMSHINTSGFHKFILEPEDVGVYIYIWETPGSQFPERDYLQDTLEVAKEMCEEDFGVPRSSWQVLGET